MTDNLHCFLYSTLVPNSKRPEDCVKRQTTNMMPDDAKYNKLLIRDLTLFFGPPSPSCDQKEKLKSL